MERMAYRVAGVPTYRRNRGVQIIATVEQQLIDKMGKREYGRLMDGISRIVHDCRRPDCARCQLAKEA